MSCEHTLKTTPTQKNNQNAMTAISRVPPYISATIAAGSNSPLALRPANYHHVSALRRFEIQTQGISPWHKYSQPRSTRSCQVGVSLNNSGSLYQHAGSYGIKKRSCGSLTLMLAHKINATACSTSGRFLLFSSKNSSLSRNNETTEAQEQGEGGAAEAEYGRRNKNKQTWRCFFYCRLYSASTRKMST